MIVKDELFQPELNKFKDIGGKINSLADYKSEIFF